MLLQARFRSTFCMKRILLLACLFLAPLSNVIPAEPANPQEQQILAVLKEVQTQQAAMAENQAKIEQKIAAINETIRFARIYGSRTGN